MEAGHGLEGSKVRQILAKKSETSESQKFHTFFPEAFRLTLNWPFGSWRSHSLHLVQAESSISFEEVSRAGVN